MARKIVSKPSSNPRLSDSTGPKYPIAQDPASLGKRSEGTESYKSTSTQGEGTFGGTRALDSGPPIPELKRSSPEAGVYQSPGQPRGGGRTSDHSDAGKVLSYVSPHLEAVRAHQDAAAGENKEKS